MLKIASRFFVSLCLMTTSVLADELPEVAPRDGLPHFHAKAIAGQPVNVAFLGGSITVAKGWRVHVRDHLKATFPKSELTELFAAISGTDSTFGACRLGHDVLSRKPDLLFVEFAVNDTGLPAERIRSAMEGIVRQTRLANPDTDLCFVYTLSQSQLPDYRAGRLATTARAMEEVAAHYGIPSIAFGPEVVRQLDAGRLLFRGSGKDLDSEGRNTDGLLVFTSDGIHPLSGGHQLYFSVAKRVLPRLWTELPATPRTLPPALTAIPLTHATIRPVTELSLSGEWTPLPARDKRTSWHIPEITPALHLATRAGAAATFEFTGTTFGLVGLKGPDCGQFSVTVNDLPPVTATFFDAFSVENHHHLTAWHYPQTLPPGKHRVRIELLDTSPDKAGILARRGYTPKDPAAFAALHLYLGGVLLPQGN